ESGAAESKLGADDGRAARAGNRDSTDAAEVAVCALLGRCASGSCGGHAACRGSPFLGQAHENGYAGRTVAPAANLQLLLRASEIGRSTGVCSGYQPILGEKD